MADKTTLEQMLEHLVNDEQAKAEELFHEYVVAKSREIYEGLIESEIEEASDEEKDEDDEEVEENFEVIEGDDEEGADPTDDLMTDLEGGEEGEEGSEEEGEEEGDMDEPATKQDVADGFDELMAKFDELAAEVGGDEMGGDEMDGMPDMDMKDAFEPEMATVREYVEKVPAGHGAEKKGSGEAGGANTKSAVAGKNDMGGTTANIAKGGEGGGTDKGLANPKAQQMSTGNINVPGGKAGGAFNTKEPGHGAEKKGAAEQGGTNATSLFRNK